MNIIKANRYTLKQGMSGSDVWALQINLNHRDARISEDGAFGSLTKTAIQRFQRSIGLTADGIAGPVTQRRLAMELMIPAQVKHNLPRGLLYGLTEGESGFLVGCVNWSVSGGVDLGWVQRRVLERDYDDAHYRNAFDGPTQFDLTGHDLRSKKDQYRGEKGATSDRRAWELAVLYHNWPVAADRLAQGLSIYQDPKTDSEPANWVKAIGVQGVETPMEWANFYISSKLQYVTNFPA